MGLFSRLHIYTVHIKPERKAGQASDIRFVEEGFSWMAFVFSTLWALYNRLWLMAGLIIALNVLMMMVAETIRLDVISLSILQLGFQVWIGFHGNDFLRSALRKRGYVTYALVSGENTMRAEQRFFDRHHEMLADI
jgi:hypothetical protein